MISERRGILGYVLLVFGDSKCVGRISPRSFERILNRQKRTQRGCADYDVVDYDAVDLVIDGPRNRCGGPRNSDVVDLVINSVMDFRMRYDIMDKSINVKIVENGHVHSDLWTQCGSGLVPDSNPRTNPGFLRNKTCPYLGVANVCEASLSRFESADPQPSKCVPVSFPEAFTTPRYGDGLFRTIPGPVLEVSFSPGLILTHIDGQIQFPTFFAAWSQGAAGSGEGGVRQWFGGASLR